MPAAKLTSALLIEQGATFRKAFGWKSGTPATPVDLTGCTARMHIRTEIDAATPLMELTTENGRIEISPLAGKVTLIISAADTALPELLPLVEQAGVFDLEIIHPDLSVTRLVQGKVKLSKEVTRG